MRTRSFIFIQLFLALYAVQTFAQSDSEERERIQHINQARGMDSLLGKKAADAMPLIKKYVFTKVPVNHYPYIKEVLRIDNFNKWSHPSTLYIFIDSSDNVARMNYFFSDITIQTAHDFEDSVAWALPKVTIPKHAPNVLICTNSPEYMNSHQILTEHWGGVSWQGPVSCRLFWEYGKWVVKVRYMIMSENYHQFGCERFWGKFIHDEVYEPDFSKE